MAAPAPGVLRKLLEGMKTGAPKPVGEHRSAVLQVTDIVPAELDEHDLWPRHGRFYVKVSDSSHSVYAALPPDQGDLVLSNRLQLGQFVQVERLEPGSPVPLLRGAKLIPGRHPLMGTPEPIIKARGVGKGGSGTTGVAVAAATRFGCGSGGGGASAAAPRRGSWDMEPASLKGTILDFEETTTPVRTATACRSPATTRGRSGKEGSSGSAGLMRASLGGALVSKVVAKAEGSASLLRQSCAVVARFPRSKSVSRIPRSPFFGEKKGSTTPPPRARPEPSCPTPPASDSKEKPNKSLFSRLQSSPHSSSTKNSTGSNRLTLPGKLGAIGKEVMQQREEAQKVALQALRDASAAETLVRMLRMFSDLSSSSRADAPASCIEQFLSFDQEIIQAVSDMEAVHAAATVSAVSKGQTEEEDPPGVLHEIQQNTSSVNVGKRRTTAAAASKAISFLTDPNELQKAILGRHSRSVSKLNDKKGAEGVHNSTSSTFANAIRTAKQIQMEAGNWFMQFLDAALESGLKKERSATASTTTPRKDQQQKGAAGGCPQSLMLKVINWVEVEQCGNSKKPLHPRAAQIARKLRIKVKNS